MNKLLYIFICVCFISCPLENITNEEPITPHEPTPDNRTQEEINAAVLEVLKKYAPHVVNMDREIEQVIELMNTLCNATKRNKDPRIGLVFKTPDKLLSLNFTDDDFGTDCGGLSLMLFDSLTALGYDTRLVQFFMEISEHSPYENHCANEVKIGEKIYALDPSFNVIFKDDKGNMLSYKEVGDQIHSDVGLIFEYVGDVVLRIEDYYIPYEQYFTYIVRAVPFGYRHQHLLDVTVYGAELYYWN